MSKLGSDFFSSQKRERKFQVFRKISINVEIDLSFNRVRVFFGVGYGFVTLSLENVEGESQDSEEEGDNEDSTEDNTGRIPMLQFYQSIYLIILHQNIFFYTTFKFLDDASDAESEASEDEIENENTQENEGNIFK